MIETLGKWEYIKNVKITLTSCEVVYCDVAVWIDDDPEEILVVPNEKTINKWLVERGEFGITLDAPEIESIEEL